MYKVYSLGSNGKGQLGLSHFDDIDVATLSYQSELSIQKIVCGGNHTILLLEDGTLIGCGDNSYGQLGSNKLAEHKWHILFNGFKASDVGCGWEFSVVLGLDGCVYSCGTGPKGELGQNDVIESWKLTEIFQVPDDYHANLIVSMQNSALVIEHNTKSETKVFAWGSNTKRQVSNDPLKKITTPTLVHEQRGSLEISLGRDFLIIYDSDKIMKSLGKVPELIEVNHLISIQSMWTSVHLWQNPATIKSFGNGRHGQLFQFEIPGDKTIKTVAVGSEHGIIVVENTVYSWGWGEHGNCGHRDTPVETDETIFGLNKIISLDNILKVYGGCATTWIVQGNSHH